MKVIKFLVYGLLIAGTTIFSSCKKEGCTDPDSKTFNEEAKEDNGTCLYEGEAVLWYGESAATGLIYDGATTLTFYVDGQIVSSTAASVYWGGSPACGQNGSITVTKDLGSVKSKAYTFSVRDQTGWEYWSGVLNFTANTCEVQELTW
tara:strand:- start:892 stop:1335 length:444 start_codon:yes stop_codon:yes gene_type:complete